jgi:hypothetical protein
MINFIFESYIFPYLIGSTFFFMPDSLVRLANYLTFLGERPSWWTRTEGRIRFARNLFLIMGGMVLTVWGTGFAAQLAYEIIKYLPKESPPALAATFATPATSILIITGLILYYSSYSLGRFAKKIMSKKTKDEIKPIIVNNTTIRIFKIFAVFLIFCAPFISFLWLKLSIR